VIAADIGCAPRTWRHAVHKRDREILARIAKVNTECGRITVHLLSMQPDDIAYADGLSQLGHAFIHLGHELVGRAEEVNPGTTSGELPTVPRELPDSGTGFAVPDAAPPPPYGEHA
jgi:hypothetical protein